MDALEKGLALRIGSRGMSGVISKWAKPLDKLFRKQRTSEWLVENSGLSGPAAQKLIEGLGVPFSDKMAHNGGTQRCLLSLVALSVQRIQVIAYSTAALDPLGCRAVHRFVAAGNSYSCFIHMSLTSEDGNEAAAPRICPPGAICFELENTH